jgi:hypothetical protein
VIIVSVRIAAAANRLTHSVPFCPFFYLFHLLLQIASGFACAFLLLLRQVILVPKKSLAGEKGVSE